MKQTKIVCSISDLRCDVDFIRSLFNAGMNVVRMNTAHATPEGLRKIIHNVRAVSPHIGILIDTKGPGSAYHGYCTTYHIQDGRSSENLRPTGDGHDARHYQCVVP